MSSSAFDLVCVKANLELCLKGRDSKNGDHKNSNQWLVNWKDWSDESISATVRRWKKAGCIQSDKQLHFTAYVEILHHAVFGHSGTPNVSQLDMWLQTPVAPVNLFHGKTDQEYIHDMSPLNNPAQFFVEPVYVISPVFDQYLGPDKCHVPGCTGTIMKRGFTAPRNVYGISSNIKAIGMEYSCLEYKVFGNMSCDRFWNNIEPWKCGNVPYFQDRSAATRDLYKLVCELRPRLSIGEITEHICQLHLQYDCELESRWLSSALFEKQKHPDHEVKVFPTSVLEISTGVSRKINSAPTASFTREICEFFIECQCREESSQYMRTLSGLSISLDSTIKIAKKANVYITESDENGKRKMHTVNAFEGGLLTGVNEDKELVICEFLGLSLYSEMNPPIFEFAECCDALGISFQTQGKICVDRCCDFRKTLQSALPGIPVFQDLAHLKMRIMDTVSKKSIHRDSLSKEISDALIEKYSSKKGSPPLYWLKEAQASRLKSVWDKYSRFENVWTVDSEGAFFRQIGHVANGCLQNNDPDWMSTMAINENWHKWLNRLSIGSHPRLNYIKSSSSRKAQEHFHISVSKSFPFEYLILKSPLRDELSNKVRILDDRTTLANAGASASLLISQSTIPTTILPENLSGQDILNTVEPLALTTPLSTSHKCLSEPVIHTPPLLNFSPASLVQSPCLLNELVAINLPEIFEAAVSEEVDAGINRPEGTKFSSPLNGLVASHSLSLPPVTAGSLQAIATGCTLFYFQPIWDCPILL
ncbi:hypothetical protein Clacol_004202 [Clathrus columnatus]|uniref:Uncharacterized protein n=1 Tax=Clathrus columnatus TaxID=1419009 RepID=A0AAV5A5U8_9AGAM|nr:hypothetical protein Clacol_004202 [Clathrus columnatus]